MKCHICCSWESYSGLVNRINDSSFCHLPLLRAGFGQSMNLLSFISNMEKYESVAME